MKALDKYIEFMNEKLEQFNKGPGNIFKEDDDKLFEMWKEVIVEEGGVKQALAAYERAGGAT